MNALGPPSGPPRYTLDVSRLLSRAGEAVPTGIDRVELAYAKYLLAHAPDRTEFAALHPLGRFGTLSHAATACFIAALSRRWESAGTETVPAGRLDPVRLGRRLLHGLMLPGSGDRTRLSFKRQAPPSRWFYLLLSHHHLTRPGFIADALARRRALFVPMVHDLIPLEYPEYCGPKQPARHRLRIATVCRLADTVLVPSEVVRSALLPHLHDVGRGHVKVAVVPHGVHLRAFADAAASHADADPRPYFVCLGTIEPRKNHLLLLNIWRRLVAELGPATPRLVIIGRRGWENENVLDMIERCPALQGVVEEHNALPDAEVTRLLLGTRALLFPSFAEGYGLPLAEALALGVPVLCSDLPVLREVGGDLPVYLDPLDGPGWNGAIKNCLDHRILSAAPFETSWDMSVRAGLGVLEHGLPVAQTAMVRTR